MDGLRARWRLGGEEDLENCAARAAELFRLKALSERSKEKASKASFKRQDEPANPNLPLSRASVNQSCQRLLPATEMCGEQEPSATHSGMRKSS